MCDTGSVERARVFYVGKSTRPKGFVLKSKLIEAIMFGKFCIQDFTILQYQINRFHVFSLYNDDTRTGGSGTECYFEWS